MKTYSKARQRRLPDDEPATKRRRISFHNEPSVCAIDRSTSEPEDSHLAGRALGSSSSVVPSSPGGRSHELASDSNLDSLTPPSSPPPTNIIKVSEGDDDEPRQTTDRGELNEAHTSRPRSPLADACANSQRHPAAKQRKSQKYTQLHLDFGQKVRTRCKTCGMEYAPSIAEDAAVHQMFHNRNLGGVELGKAFVDTDACRSRSLWQGNNGNCIIECDWRGSKTLKSKVRMVLDVVDKELGAVKVEDERLWFNPEIDPLETHFTAYLYLKSSKCVGLCLVQNLLIAYKVRPPERRAKGATSITQHQRTMMIATKPDGMIMGISRIWISSGHRKEGLATRLLDCAQNNFVYGFPVKKEYTAFSQPTDSGAALARKWYGKESGWHVYTE